MSTAQLNVRMDSLLKEEGNRALSRAGYSPTGAVRALWEFARRNAGDMESLRSLLRRLDSGIVESDTPSRPETNVAEQMTQLRQELYDQIGVPLKTHAEAEVFPEDLQIQVDEDRRSLVEAYAERSAARGL